MSAEVAPPVASTPGISDAHAAAPQNVTKTVAEDGGMTAHADAAGDGHISDSAHPQQFPILDGRAAANDRASRTDVLAMAVPSQAPMSDKLPSRILIAPYGDVVSMHGTFVVDEQAMRDTIAAFEAHATDLPIDFEHQSLGGAFSAPNGLAPAAGWIKSLTAVLPGGAIVRPRRRGHNNATGDADANDLTPGLWAEVEWTRPAAEQLAARQYRYLSPVALVRRGDGRMIGLHSVALTNKPAIVGARPIIANDGGTAPQAVAAGSGVERLRRAMALDARADDECVLIAAAQRLTALQRLADERVARERVERAAVEGKLAGAQFDWALRLALRDPAAFDEWAAGAPRIVPLGRIAPPEARDAASEDETARRRAAEEYRRNEAVLGRLCSEEAFVADALRGLGQSTS